MQSKALGGVHHISCHERPLKGMDRGGRGAQTCASDLWYGGGEGGVFT